jgi:hypothetical protein
VGQLNILDSKENSPIAAKLTALLRSQNLTIHSSLTNTTIHTLQVDQIQFVLQNARVLGNYVQKLRDARSDIEMTPYLIERHSWTLESWQTIEWSSHGESLHKLPQWCQKTTIQMIHRWLHTSNSYSVKTLVLGNYAPTARVGTRTKYIIYCANTRSHQQMGPRQLPT